MPSQQLDIPATAPLTPRDRLLLVQLLQLDASLEHRCPESAYLLQHAARLLGEGRDDEAVVALRSAPAGAVRAMADLVALHLPAER